MIASDKTGENLSFGTTVPFITSATTDEQLAADTVYLVQRLAEDHRQYVDSAPPEDVDTCTVTIPVPVLPSEEDSHNDLQLAALKGVTAVTSALAAEGFVVLSVTPIATALSDDDTVLPGYLVYGALAPAAEEIMDGYGDYRTAGAWTERAGEIYGNAALEQYRERMQASMESIMSRIAGEETH